jgi:hypothetical protein
MIVFATAGALTPATAEARAGPRTAGRGAQKRPPSGSALLPSTIGSCTDYIERTRRAEADDS